MNQRQGNLFSGSGSWSPPVPEPRPLLNPAGLTDAALAAAIVGTTQRDAAALTAEAARRRPPDIEAALEALCRRFKGFGVSSEVHEQRVALAALRDLGGTAAADAINRLIASDAVQGPGLRHLVAAASTPGVRVPTDRLARWLRDASPEVRALACQCARGGADIAALLIDLMDDLHPPVAIAAARALGRMGRTEARARLRIDLGTAPTVETIRAIGPIAETDDLVLLKRRALAAPELTEAVLAVLDDSDDRLAPAFAAEIRQGRSLAAGR